MELIKIIFGNVRIYKLNSRSDNRGSLTYLYEENIPDFEIKESRIYTIPKKGTFFGIHYRDESDPMTKLISVIKGCGLDYLIDLRKESTTYLKWEEIELSEENKLAVLIPAGIGNAFLTTEDNTMQSFVINKSGENGYSKKLNYTEKQIGLKLPIPITDISDYDLNAPFLN
ncbi:MAG: dTDP-4-dehydrorhamnose 3,5-epimerase family protein [Treponema sp.]|nr:dTDP-4-dehydrorhamnose 3,5-epimerase family protein [Treponema sp.]